jgi:hypothetical protein
MPASIERWPGGPRLLDALGFDEPVRATTPVASAVEPRLPP